MIGREELLHEIAREEARLAALQAEAEECAARLATLRDRMPAEQPAQRVISLDDSPVLLLAGVAFNILRLIGQKMLAHPKAMPARLDIQRRRLGSVIRDLIYIACKRVRHAGSVKLRFGVQCPWFNSFEKIYQDLLRKPSLAA